MNVRLVGSNGDKHAEGPLSEQLAICSILKRNERYYKFKGVYSGVVLFEEIEQPYIITEF